MRFFNYGRKSVFSDKSDSIDNQFRMCRDYCECKFPGQIDTWEEFSDEDFTGANVERPGLKEMIEQIQDGLCDALVVYQLDRLSRDVRDFANLYALLEENSVMFISIKESIDTQTPIGRAMMYVTAVFAQMERETIAARVSDNMLGLARKGFWTGGNPPVGFVRERIMVNGRKHCTIIQDPEGVEYVRWIFSEFLDNGYSLQSMETAFRKRGIKTRSGKFFSTTQLHKILTSSLYVEGTAAVYDFYENKGCHMDTPREQWDGSAGVMIYGRTTEKNKKHQMQPPSEWHVCLGLHEPFLPADQWLEVQNRFAQNKFDKTMKYDVPLLKGVLRCSCGSAMLVSRKKKVRGGVSSWYYCLKRMRQGVEACERSQIKCELLDEKVLDVMRQIEADPELIRQYVDKPAENSGPDVKKTSAAVSACEAKIGRLAQTLALSSNSTAAKYIVAEMERLDLELAALRREHTLALSSNRAAKKAEKSVDAKAADIRDLIRGLDSFSASDRNAILKSIVKELTWDGETLFLKL